MILPNYTTFRSVFGVAPIANDGYKTFDYAHMQQAFYPSSLGIGAFVGTVSSFAFPFTMVAASSGADAVFGVDEWDWYISQRSDVTASKYLSVTPVVTGTQTFSGSVTMQLSSRGAAKYPVITADSLYRIFLDVVAYARHRADSKIYVLDFTRVLFSQS